MCSLLDTSKTPRSTGTNETDLATSWTVLGDSTGHTNVLMVTTTVGMLYRVLGYTTNLGPAVSLDGILVVGTAGLEQGLVGTTTSRYNANLGTDGRGYRLLTARGQSQTGRTLVFVVRDHNRKGTRATGKGTAVSQFGFHVADDSTFWDDIQGKNIAHRQGGLLAAVNELTRVHALGAHQEFIVFLIAIGVTELHLCYWCTPSRVVQNLLDDTTNVTVLFGIVQSSQLDSTLASPRVRLEDGGLTLALCLITIRK